MLMVQLEPPSLGLQGDQVYRTLQPCRALAQATKHQILCGTWLSKTMRRAAHVCDVLVLCQAVEVDFLPLLAARRAARRPTIFEINDDFTALPPFNAAAEFYKNPLIRSLAYQLARTCDGLQLSSHGLMHRFGALASRIVLLENQLQVLQPHRPRQGALRLGFAGSLGHRDDLASIVPVLRDVLMAHPEVTFAAMVPGPLQTLLAALPSQQTELHGPGTLQDYRLFLQTFDIGLAPLLDSPFNAGRSDVKYLEYTDAGALSVVQHSPAYRHAVTHGDNGLVFANGAELREALHAALSDGERRRQMVHRARLAVARSRLEHQHVHRRGDFMAQLQPIPEPHDPSGVARFAALTQQAPIDGDTALPNFARVVLSAAETTLYRGLLQRHHPQLALNLYAEAARHNVGWQAQLYAGQLHADGHAAIAALKQGLALHPAGLSLWHTLAKRYAELGDAPKARAALGRVTKLAPAFAPAHEALATLALHRGQDGVALQALATALSVNPYYRAPVLPLCRLHLRQGKPERALSVLAGSCAKLGEDPAEEALRQYIQRCHFSAGCATAMPSSAGILKGASA